MIQELDEKVIRKHLLGNLTEEERARAEERLFADDDYFELLTVIEEELIDEYVSGDLTDEDRKRFEAHFLSTPERREKLGFAQTLNEYILQDDVKADAPGPILVPRSDPTRPVWWKQAFSSPYSGLAAAAMIVIAIGVTGWFIISHKTGPSQGIAALDQAYHDQRPVESRITGLHYAPPPPVTRGGGQEKFDYVARDRAQALIQMEAGEHPNAQSYHDLGRLYLTQHEFDKAIEQFEKALTLNDKSAQLHSDLGAVYLERAVSNADKLNIGDLNKSLEHLNRAIELDNSLLPAYFNKALSLQRMNALGLAREAWEDYLKRDAGSEWSKEAERNLRLLQNQGAGNKTSEEVFQDFLSAYRQKDEARAWRIQSQTKEMITGTMIPFQLAQRFVAAGLSGQTQAGTESLEAFRFAGALEKKNNDDPFFAELAEFYAEAVKKNAVTLKQASESLAQGYQLCLQGRYGDAYQPFGSAKDLFLKTGNRWEAKVVDYWLAYCFSQQGELKKSSDLLLAVAEDCRNRNYHWLEGQSYCWLANNSALLGEYSLGIEQDKRALNIATTTGDLYNSQKVSSQLAEDYKFLGRLGEALEFNRSSLPLADAYFVSFRQFWRSLNSTTDTLFALRQYAAAEAFEQEALRLATRQFNDPVLIHNTYVRLGQIYTGQQNYPAATQALEMSLEAIRAIGNDQISQKFIGQSVFQIGNVRRQAGDLDAALNYYRQAAQKFDSTEFGLYNYNTRKGMLLCHLLNKDDPAIEQELPVVLNLFEQNRQKIKEEQSLNHFFDAEQNVYDLAIDYENSRKNEEQSFNYAEFSKARSLLGALTSNDAAAPGAVISPASPPLTFARLRERPLPGLQLIEYAVLQSRLLIWVVTKTRFEVIDRPISVADLESLTNQYLRILPGGDKDSIEQERRLASQLYEWLFAPVEGYLNKAEDVAIVPDKFLFKVPFAALLSQETGRRVVNDYTLLYAPSATVLVICSDLARLKTQKKEAERLLSVGDPLFNRQQHPDLRDLPSAAFEAGKVAFYYRTRAILIKDAALKERIEPELTCADIIHFAAHYVADDFSPDKSRLLLTAKTSTKTDNAAASDLTLLEIQSMRLPNAKVAILSACQSGIERYYAGEGLIGLSRAFIMAGIPLVVASQWSVESDSTAELMIDFHRLRKTQNMSTTQALRQAQLDMLSHEDERYRRPYYWAAFFPIGGHASY